MSIIKFTKLSWMVQMMLLGCCERKMSDVGGGYSFKSSGVDVHMGKEYQFIFHRAQC